MGKGADISEYRLVTNINTYVAGGRSFLAFKATGGAKGWNYVDPTLAKNLDLVAPKGPVLGIAYHFLRQGTSGATQADHFLAHVPHQGVVLVCDFEFHKPSNSFPTPAELDTFVNRVKAVTGRWPWVYTSRGVWASLVVPASTPVAPECSLWIADWADPLEPINYGGWTEAVLRQYTDAATVPGIDKPCDDNVLLGTELDLLRGAWGSENVSAQDRGWGPPCPAADIVNIQAGGRSFNVHKRVAKIFTAFITELVDRGYAINTGTLDDWSYNCRKIAGSTSWSNHAWGLAVDINSLRNPMGSTLVTDMPAWVRDAPALLKKYGLKWGGTYQSRPDAMHFEFILGPGDADRISAALGEGDDMTAADVAAINAHTSAMMRDGVRYNDHGETETTGAPNNHKEIRADLAELSVLLRGQADDETKILAAIAAAKTNPTQLAAAIVDGLKADGVITADADEDAIAAVVGAKVVEALQQVTFTATS